MARTFYFAICAAILISGLPVAAGAQQAEPPAPAVGTVEAKLQPISRSFDFVGRVKSIERVDITARVSGYLQAVLFKEGDIVEEGDPLYQIESDQYEAAVQQTQGALERSQAALTLATIQRQRAADLFAKGTGTAVSRDQTVAEEQQAKGAVTTDQANLTAANINLGYTKIVSPIAGRIGLTSLTKGNVVGPDSGVLATIVTQNPMYVLFPVSQREFLQAREAGKPADTASIKVQLRFSDGTAYAELGQIDFIDVMVDNATDTVMVRALMPNPSGALVDGQLVRVELQSGTKQEKVVVPQSALLADQGGTYVFVVEDGKAVAKRLKLGGESGTNVVVEEGLTAGAEVIVEGLQTVRPNAPVRATRLPIALDPS